MKRSMGSIFMIIILSRGEQLYFNFPQKHKQWRYKGKSDRYQRQELFNYICFKVDETFGSYAQVIERRSVATLRILSTENSCLLWQNRLDSVISMKHTSKNNLAIPHWRIRVFRVKTLIVNWTVTKIQNICKCLEARTGMKKKSPKSNYWSFRTDF